MRRYRRGVTSASPWAFLRSFGANWFTLMSGPVSVPFTFIALIVENTWLKIFGLLAIICVVVDSYLIWRQERLRKAREFYNVTPSARIERVTRVFYDLLRRGKALQDAPLEEQRAWDEAVQATMAKYLSRGPADQYLTATRHIGPERAILPFESDQLERALRFIGNVLDHCGQPGASWVITWTDDD